MRTDYYIRAVSSVKRLLTEKQQSPLSVYGLSFRVYAELREDRLDPTQSRHGDKFVDIDGYTIPQYALTKEGEKKLARGDYDGRKRRWKDSAEPDKV